MALKTCRQSGNAFVITLISVVLLGALTMVVARQMSGGAANSISDEKVALYANQVINQATSAANVVQQMMSTGTTVDTLNFDLPTDAAFNTGTTINKLYHPAGGGLNVLPSIPADMVGTGGFNVASVGIDFVEWTPSASSDVVMRVFDLRQEVCAAINKRLTGSETIPDWNGDFEDFGNESGSMFAVNCATCSGRPMLCVKDLSDNVYGFYAVLYGR